MSRTILSVTQKMVRELKFCKMDGLVFFLSIIQQSHFFLHFIYFPVFNDGTKKNLLQLDGTIPVKYKGKTNTTATYIVWL